MNKTVFLALSVAVLALSACEEMYAPPSVNENRMQVHEEKFSQQVPVAQLNDDYIGGVLHDYSQAGRGPIDVTITYDPQSKTNTAMRASDEAVRISGAMRKQGANDVITSILPVREQGRESVAIIAYSSYQASGPADCGVMPGLRDTTVEHDQGYKLGCSVETLFANQIADPSDLLGDSEISAYRDGQATATSVNMYRVGAPNKPLEGVTASDD